jgi:hypothetical protein
MPELGKLNTYSRIFTSKFSAYSLSSRILSKYAAHYYHILTILGDLHKL